MCQQACPNRTGWCYIVDNIHLKLYPQNLKSWSIAVNKEPDIITIDICPIELTKTLMTAKAILKNPLRDASETTIIQNAVPPSATPPSPYPLPYYFPYNIPSYPQHFRPPSPCAQHLPAPTTADRYGDDERRYRYLMNVRVLLLPMIN